MPTVTQELTPAKSLLQSGRYREAVEALADLNLSGECESVRGEYYLLYGEAEMFLGNYHHDHLDRAVDLLKMTSEHNLFARAKYLKGWQWQSLGEYRLARETLIEAYTAFLRTDNFAWAARVLNRLSYICLIIGDINQSVENLEKAIKFNEISGETVRTLVCRNNLASILRRNGRLLDSQEVYLMNADQVEMLGDKNKGVYHLGFALTSIFLEDFKEAEKQLSLAEKITVNFQREKAQYYECLGRLEYFRQNYRQAAKALEKSLELSIALAAESDHVSQVKRLLGDVYFELGRYDDARAMADEAGRIAENLNERLEIAACRRLMGRLELNSGNREEGRRYLQKALDLFTAVEAHYEIAVTRCLLAQYRLFDPEQNRLQLYLAREYFKQNNLENRLKQIDDGALTKSDTSKQNKNAVEAPVIIYKGTTMNQLLAYARQAADSDMTVLLTGETGTGKDLLAKYIHCYSGRKGEFISVNAAAVPTSMVESELFGYARGAFTGANRDKPGLFEMAENGTFYLNELADTTREFQAKLLEVLETRLVRRLGENKNRKVNFRLICATNHDLEESIKINSFRLDLYHRIKEIPIRLPALKERPEDIESLIKFFLEQKGVHFNGHYSDDFKNLVGILTGGVWEGNIRQLRHEINRLWLASNESLKAMVPLARQTCHISEKERLMNILEQARGNKSRAARMLGINESTFRYRLNKYNKPE